MGCHGWEGPQRGTDLTFSTGVDRHGHGRNMLEPEEPNHLNPAVFDFETVLVASFKDLEAVEAPEQ